MKPYPHYKPFPELWLPRVPGHWDQRKIKFLFSERSEKGFPEEPLLAATQNHGVITKADYETRTVEAQKDLHLLKLVRVGDFVISLRSFQGGIEYAYHQGIISPAYTIMVPSREIDSGYFRYLAKSAPFLDLLRLCVTGIREGQNIDYQRLKNHFIPLPPPPEQSRIVRHLDAKTAAIADLIRAKEREIELLRELIVLHAEESMQAATGKRFRLKRFVRQITEEITVEPSRTYHPLGVLNRGRGLFRKDSVLGADLGDSTFFHVYPGDMIISGQFAWEGAVAMLEESERGCIASHRYPLVRSASDKLRLEYLWAFFQTHYGDMILNLHSHGAAGRNRPLNFGELIDEYVPIPSIDKQDKIAGLVRKLSLLRRNATTFKTRMMELRTRLVSDAVTGAVEV